MDIKKFTEILNDKSFMNYKKMSYKYSDDFNKKDLRGFSSSPLEFRVKRLKLFI